MTDTLLVTLYWLLLALPGAALARLALPRLARSAGFGALALGGLMSAALLSVPLLIGYALRLPLAWFTAAVVIATAIGLLALVPRLGRFLRTLRWPNLSVAAIIAGAALAVLAFDLVLGARVGAPISHDPAISGGASYDAVVHVSRTRAALDRGLTNDDHLVVGRVFYPIYHSNLLHPLTATCAQLTGLPPHEVFYHSLVAGKLYIASAFFLLAFVATGRREAGWATVLLMVLLRGPWVFVTLPKHIAEMVWFPVALAGLAMLLSTSARRREGAVVLCAASLVAGVTHPLYAALLAVGAGGAAGLATLVVLLPKLRTFVLTRAAHRTIASREAAILTMVAVGLLLLPGLPLPAISSFTGVGVGIQLEQQAWQTPERADEPPEAGSNTAAPPPASTAGPSRTGLSVRDPATFALTRNFAMRGVLTIAAVAALLALVPRRRPEIIALAAVPAAIAVMMFTPGVYQFLVKALSAEWVVARLDTLATASANVLIAAGIAVVATRLAADRLSAIRALPALRSAVAVCVVALLAFQFRGGHYPWSAYIARAAEPASDRAARTLTPARELAELLEETLGPDPHATLLANDAFSPLAGVVTDVRGLSARSASDGVRDVFLRRYWINLAQGSSTTPVPLERTLIVRAWGIDAALFATSPRDLSGLRATVTQDASGRFAIAELVDAAQSTLARELASTDRHAELIELLEATKTDGSPAALWRLELRARALAESGRFADAADVFERALEIAPRSPRLLMDAGRAAAAAGRFEVFEDRFETAFRVAVESNNLGWAGEIADEHARVLRVLGEPDRADAVLQRAAEVLEADGANGQRDAEPR
jgi:hypothetical protein